MNISFIVSVVTVQVPNDQVKTHFSGQIKSRNQIQIAYTSESEKKSAFLCVFAVLI